MITDQDRVFRALLGRAKKKNASTGKRFVLKDRVFFPLFKTKDRDMLSAKLHLSIHFIRHPKKSISLENKVSSISV